MPVAVGTERKQLFAYDRVIKTRGWQSLLIVNPRLDAEANGLLAFCPRLRITVVWDPEYLAPLAPAATERARRTAVLARLQVTSRANPRLRLVIGEPLLVASRLAQEQHAEALEAFSGAVLANLDTTTPLAPQLRAWAALCAPEGLLLGKQHADLKLRAELSAVSKLWRPWPNGLWLLEVKHVIPPEIRRESPEIPAVDGPIQQESSADTSCEISGENARIGPIKPPVGSRTRPVWETLEANLAS